MRQPVCQHLQQRRRRRRRGSRRQATASQPGAGGDGLYALLGHDFAATFGLAYEFAAMTDGTHYYVAGGGGGGGWGNPP